MLTNTQVKEKIRMNEAFTFDDVLIVPKFSEIESRKDVDLASNPVFLPFLPFPVISANMDTVTGPEMAKAMAKAGGIGCLHRFCTIEENVKMFNNSLYGGFDSPVSPMISIGLGKQELERAEALVSAGAHTIVVDVANGAQMSVVNQVKALKQIFKNSIGIIVGNFASTSGVQDFLLRSGPTVDGVKVGIGPGSACTTRIKTGVGYPQLSAILEIKRRLAGTGIGVIADGGMKTPGDLAKALGAGADYCMIGGMVAGTDETPGELIVDYDVHHEDCTHVFYDMEEGYFPIEKADKNKSYTCVKINKKYRGSASKESYEAQGKDAKHRTSEGESFLIPYKGPVANILGDIEGGIRSAFTYVGARTLKEFHEKVDFVRISNAGYAEGLPHGKK